VLVTPFPFHIRHSFTSGLFPHTLTALLLSLSWALGNRAYVMDQRNCRQLSYFW